MAVLIEGMLGAGDCIRQRAIVKYWLNQQEQVFVKTPWPGLLEDLPVHCIPVPTGLRTQAKNAKREEARYSPVRPIGNVRKVRVWYTHDGIRQTGSFLKATLLNTGTPMTETDYSLPVPSTWGTPRILALPWTKPIMVVRPLCDRNEWGGTHTRNPDHATYRALFNSIRGRFFVVSIADLEANKEWLSDGPLDCDVAFHAGELTFQEMAFLTRGAALMFASPGFYVADALAPFLAIDPIVPDACFSDVCTHSKAIDMPSALHRLKEFSNACLRDRQVIPQPAEVEPEGLAQAVSQ
ncbi:MAG: hypothetical protein V4532_09295 [Pseudomonadota bacterium]